MVKKRRKRNKGFTLIEFLAAIIVLSIIALIAVPAVISWTDSFRNTYYVSLEKNVSLSGNDYFVEHRSSLPKDVDMTSLIEIPNLVRDGYIEEVKDEDEGKCEGYVLARKKDASTYEYTTCLSCANGYRTESVYCTEEYLPENNYILKIPKDYEHELNTPFTPKNAGLYIRGKTLVDDKIVPYEHNVNPNQEGVYTLKYRYENAKCDREPCETKVSVGDYSGPTNLKVDLRYHDGKKEVYPSGTWTNRDVLQSATSIDVGSGVSHYIYSTNGKDYKKMENPMLANTTQNTIYYVKGVDTLGNESKSTYSYTIRIDKIKPVIKVVEAKVTKNHGVSYNLLTGVSASDTGGSGISGSIVATVNGKTVTNAKELKPGTHTITYTVKDKAGNIGTATRTLTLKDVTGPENLKVVLTYGDGKKESYPAGTWTNRPVVITASAYDAGVGVSHYIYSTDNKTYKTMTNPMIINTTTNATYYIKAVDKVGNQSKQMIKNIIRIDKKGPTIQGNLTPIEIFEGDKYNILNNVSATDGKGESGMDGGVSASIQGQKGISTLYLKPDTYTITYTAKDKVGNVSTKTRSLKVKPIPIPSDDAFQYSEVILETKDWEVPADGWYKFYVIGVGGKGATLNVDCSTSELFCGVQFLGTPNDEESLFIGGGGGGTAVHQVYLRKGSVYHAIVDQELLYSNSGSSITIDGQKVMAQAGCTYEYRFGSNPLAFTCPGWNGEIDGGHAQGGNVANYTGENDRNQFNWIMGGDAGGHGEVKYAQKRYETYDIKVREVSSGLSIYYFDTSDETFGTRYGAGDQGDVCFIDTCMSVSYFEGTYVGDGRSVGAIVIEKARK